ncbi:hypothetical protein [[Mycoplasma] collis]|uniref:hypothetical protein n=1 Tax=[Mycoplasma] collis TaxID=2127 RepID=UPI0012EBEA96|nr:hypothetical protein [[Mycoplasma] collis]
MKKNHLISRTPNDLDIIIVSNKIDSYTLNKHWENLKSKLNILKIIIDNPIFKKVQIQFDDKKFILECSLIKTISSDFYLPIYKNEIYEVVPEYVFLGKIFQIYKIYKTNILTKDEFYIKLNQNINDINEVFVNWNKLNISQFKSNKIILEAFFNNVNIWFYLHDFNICNFFEGNFYLIELITSKLNYKNFFENMMNFYNLFDNETNYIFSKIINIFLINKYRILDILSENETLKNDIQIWSTNKKKLFFPKFKKFKFFGNVIKTSDDKLILDSLTFSLTKFFENENLLFFKKIKILFKSSSYWNENNLIISKKFIFKNVLDKTYISYKIDNTLNDNEILFPLFKNKIFIIENYIKILFSLLLFNKSKINTNL